MGRIRLRKADRVRVAGKGCHKAQYVWGKRKDKVFPCGPKDS